MAEAIEAAKSKVNASEKPIDFGPVIYQRNIKEKVVGCIIARITKANHCRWWPSSTKSLRLWKSFFVWWRPIIDGCNQRDGELSARNFLSSSASGSGWLPWKKRWRWLTIMNTVTEPVFSHVMAKPRVTSLIPIIEGHGWSMCLYLLPVRITVLAVPVSVLCWRSTCLRDQACAFTQTKKPVPQPLAFVRVFVKFKSFLFLLSVRHWSIWIPGSSFLFLIFKTDSAVFIGRLSPWWRPFFLWWPKYRFSSLLL